MDIIKVYLLYVNFPLGKALQGFVSLAFIDATAI